MVQESTMICVDNSEWMRNGDFPPTRLQSQQDAANLVLQFKLRANPENAVGLLAMANDVQVLSTMTQESGRLFMKLHQLEANGSCNLLPAIKVAHLALKHRQNRNHKMRIIIFCGSPVHDVDTIELTKLAKKLKKEKVQCDVICFGENDSTNVRILSHFVDTLNGRDGITSNMLIVPAGTALTDAVGTSIICRSEDGTNNVAMGTGAFEFGVDPEDDPDLALALRVSMEEERARQAAEQRAQQPAPQPAAEPMQQDDVTGMDEAQQLEWALRMSMQETAPAVAPAQQAPAAAPAAEQPMDTQPPQSSDNLDDLMNDPELLQRIVNDMPDKEKEKKATKKEGEK